MVFLEKADCQQDSAGEGQGNIVLEIQAQPEKAAVPQGSQGKSCNSILHHGQCGSQAYSHIKIPADIYKEEGS